MKWGFGEVGANGGGRGEGSGGGVGKENVAKLKLVRGEKIQDRRGLPAGIEQRRLTRNFIPNQVAVYCHTLGTRGDAAQLAPNAQIFFCRQPAVGDPFPLLRV